MKELGREKRGEVVEGTSEKYSEGAINI